jgi:hypothetical protein
MSLKKYVNMKSTKYGNLVYSVGIINHYTIWQQQQQWYFHFITIIPTAILTKIKTFSDNNDKTLKILPILWYTKTKNHLFYCLWFFFKHSWLL